MMLAPRRIAPVVTAVSWISGNRMSFNCESEVLSKEKTSFSMFSRTIYCVSLVRSTPDQRYTASSNTNRTSWVNTEFQKPKSSISCTTFPKASLANSTTKRLRASIQHNVYMYYSMVSSTHPKHVHKFKYICNTKQSYLSHTTFHVLILSPWMKRAILSLMWPQWVNCQRIKTRREPII